MAQFVQQQAQKLLHGGQGQPLGAGQGQTLLGGQGQNPLVGQAQNFLHGGQGQNPLMGQAQNPIMAQAQNLLHGGQGQNPIMGQAQNLFHSGPGYKQDTTLLRSNEVCGTQCYNPCTLHGGNQGATIIQRDVRMTDGSPTHIIQGSPRLVQGSPRLVQGSPRLIQGSPTGLQGSPFRGQTGFTQSLGQTFQQTNFVQGQNLGHVHQHQHLNQQPVFMSTGETRVETIYEKPIIVEHHEQAVVKSLYEGQQLIRVDETDVRQSHTMAPIVKEIHQDIIHQHHKDVLIEHKKDIVHEHHQNIIHEHNQPIVYEKHIHEHHQPIIHEKHTTLVEERHVPIVRETHLQSTNVQNRKEVITEVYEAPVVTESFSQPIVHTSQETTILESDRTQGFNQGHIHTHGNQGFSQGGTTIIEETRTTTNQNLGGTGFVQEGYGQGYGGQQTYLGDNQTYVNEVDEFGRPRKAGFFQNLKTKMGGHKNKEPKIL